MNELKDKIQHETDEIARLQDENTRLNIEIGILNKIQAWIVLKIPIVQWVLPRIYPPKIII